MSASVRGMMPDTTTKRFNIILPEDLHVELKKKCAEDRVSMSDKVRELVSDYVGTPVNNVAFKGMRTADAEVLSTIQQLTERVKNG